MAASLRFGPPPPDLVVVRNLPKAGPSFHVRGDFVLVRVRISGQWALAVLCGWTWVPKEGRCARIVVPTDGAYISEWYRFNPASVDRLGVDHASGDVGLVPPDISSRADNGRRV